MWGDGFGTVGRRFWNRWLAVLEPGSGVMLLVRFLNASIDGLAFEIGADRYHKGEVF